MPYQIYETSGLNVITSDFRDIRTEFKRLGYTARDIAYNYLTKRAQKVYGSQVRRFMFSRPYTQEGRSSPSVTSIFTATQVRSSANVST